MEDSILIVMSLKEAKEFLDRKGDWRYMATLETVKTQEDLDSLIEDLSKYISLKEEDDGYCKCCGVNAPMHESDLCKECI